MGRGRLGRGGGGGRTREGGGGEVRVRRRLGSLRVMIGDGSQRNGSGSSSRGDMGGWHGLEGGLKVGVGPMLQEHLHQLVQPVLGSNVNRSFSLAVFGVRLSAVVNEKYGRCLVALLGRPVEERAARAWVEGV